MLKILHVLFVILIYISILLPGPLQYIYIIRKIIFALLIAFYFAYVLMCDIKWPRNIILLVFGIIAIESLFALQGAINNHNLDDILFFVQPFLYILLLFVLLSLMKEYSIEKYLRHIFIAVIILALSALTFTFAIYFVGYADIYSISEYYNPNIIVRWSDENVRVYPRTAYFFPMAFAYLFYNKNFDPISKVFYFLVLFLATYFAKSYGLLAIVLFVLAVTSSYGKHKIYKTFVILVCGLLITFLLLNINEIYGSRATFKQRSVDLKIQQLNFVAESSLNSLEVLIGKGIGYRFSVDERHEQDRNIEVGPIQWFITNGVLGIIFYSFFYLYPVFSSFRRRNLNNPVIFLIVISQLSLFLLNFTNPTLSGFSGLIFVMLYICIVQNSKSELVHVKVV